jgi:transcription-repair coupling factor (superfamily II helicase)
MITSVNALLQKTVAPSQIKDLGIYLQIGSKISLPEIAEFLTAKGYNREVCANNVGDFAVRGGIVDIVMQQAADLIGYRVDFFGNEVESIKVFDPITQITQESVKSLEILPASEVIMSKKTVENFRQKYRTAFGASIDDNMAEKVQITVIATGFENVAAQKNAAGQMRQQITHPSAALPVLGKFKVAGSHRKFRLAGGHRGQALTHAHRCREVLPAVFFQTGFGIEQIHLRRGA